MTIKRWLVSGAMLAVAALPAALGMAANGQGPDNTQKHVSGVNAALAGDPDDGGQAHIAASVDLARVGRTVSMLPRPGDPPVITHVSHILLTVFSGSAARPGLEPCPCTSPLCKNGCILPAASVLADDPNAGGQVHLMTFRDPAAPPTVRD